MIPMIRHVATVSAGASENIWITERTGSDALPFGYWHSGCQYGGTGYADVSAARYAAVEHVCGKPQHNERYESAGSVVDRATRAAPGGPERLPIRDRLQRMHSLLADLNALQEQDGRGVLVRVLKALSDYTPGTTFDADSRDAREVVRMWLLDQAREDPLGVFDPAQEYGISDPEGMNP